MASRAPILLITAILCAARCFASASDTIAAGSAISGSQTVVSEGRSFELGFFRPAAAINSSCYYVGIWYKKAVSGCTPVWVANRASPVVDPASSRLTVAADGNLVLTDETGRLVWSTNVSSAGSRGGTVAVILDTGNLVLRRERNGDLLWQSMEHPTDTWLPGARVGLNKITGDAQTVAAWKNSGDPAPGVFSFGIDPNGTKQYFIWWNRTVRYWSSGEWDGDIFAGIPEMMSHYIFNFKFVSNANASYFTYWLKDPAVISRLVLDVSGQMRQLTWMPAADEWMIIWPEPHQLCDVYAVCGAFAVCDEKSQPLCSCLPGFRPASAADWQLEDHTQGCRRNNPLKYCRSTNISANDGKDGDDDAFLLMPGISLPKNPYHVQAPAAAAQVDCRLACLRSCDCSAYSDDGDVCSLWHGDLLNMQRRSDVDEAAAVANNLYIRLSAMDIASKGSTKRRLTLACISSAVSILALSVVASVLVCTYKRRQSMKLLMMAASAESGNLVAFKYGDLRRATKNFSEKLGGGSFGSVYKGELSGGAGACAVAVKKLEGLLYVGDKQFRNEVRTIGTVHHVNLVRLRGFCSRGGERLLVYDYMPNGSLEKLLFGGSSSSAVLSWSARYRIAVGAARGLLYLHDGCRDCIIHCDVKPENILLDGDLVAKVADFGMAKLVGREFSRVLTTVRGTVGYLAPEWISGVPVTAKADVYSYGKVLLEIVSGRRNTTRWRRRPSSSVSSAVDRDCTSCCDHYHYFPAVAARKVQEGEVLALLDARLNGDADPRELDRACRVACWCVQDDEAHRPTMEQVVQALEGVVAMGVPPVPTSLQDYAGDDTAGSGDWEYPSDDHST